MKIEGERNEEIECVWASLGFFRVRWFVGVRYRVDEGVFYLVYDMTTNGCNAISKEKGEERREEGGQKEGREERREGERKRSLKFAGRIIIIMDTHTFLFVMRTM